MGVVDDVVFKTTKQVLVGAIMRDRRFPSTYSENMDINTTLKDL